MKKFHDVIQDEAGNIVAGAELYVRDNATLALVTLYSDNGSTTTANPVVSGSDGYVTFFTADATLKLEVYVDGEEEKVITDYQHYDDLDNEIKALRSVTSAANKLFYFTGSGTGTVADLTAFARTLLDDADAAAALTTLGISAFVQTILDDADAAAVFTTLGISAFAQTILDDANAAASRTTLGLGTAATFDEATAAQYRANTADKILTTDVVWAAADYVTLNDAGGNIAVDLSTGINFAMTMDGDYTLSAPSNGKAGQTGAIVFTQDGTGTQTLAFNAAWKFAGGTDAVLSTAASTVDILFYQVLPNGTDVYATLVKGVA